MRKIASILAYVIAILAISTMAHEVKAQPLAEKILASMQRWTELAAPEKTYVLTDKEVYTVGETVWMSIWVVNGITHEPGTGSGMAHIDLVDANGQSLVSRMFMLTVGRGAAQIELPADLPPGEYQIHAYTARMRSYDEGFQFRRTLRILGNGSQLASTLDPVALAAPVLRLFPESGDLVHGLPTRVAFKAAFDDGTGAALTGIVLDDTGATVARFSTIHEGLGFFELTPDINRRYTAVAELPGEGELRVDLPNVKPRGLQLSVESASVGASVSLHSTEPRNDLILIAHQRGTPVWAAMSSEARPLLEGFIPADRMRSGIVHVTAFDSTGNPVAERLFFHANAVDTLQAESLTADSLYGLRSKVSIPLQFSLDGKAAYPSVAVRVTEEEADISHGLDLTSWLLIGSDLYGSVPNLADYIYGEGRNHVDLLMMTHGWRRFNWPEVLDGKIEALPDPTDGFEVRGRVTLTRNREGIAGSKVVVMHRSGDGGVGETVTDPQGFFTVKDMAFADSTQITVHADDLGGRLSLRIELFDIISPKGASSFLPGRMDPEWVSVYSDYMESVRQRLAVDRLYGVELPAYTLEEITVTDSRIRERPVASRLLVEPDRVIRVQDQAHVAGKALDYLARQSVGLYATQEFDGFRHYWVFRDRSSSSLFQNEFCNNEGCIPLLLIDGVEADWRRDAGLLNATDVEAIEVLRGPNAAMYGSRAAGGVVSIVTRVGREVDRSNLSTISVSGYTHPREFFSPDYGVAATGARRPDLRSTLHWAPAKAANDQGVLRIEFWTGDRAGRWTLHVEGIDEYGATVRYRKPIVVAE